LQGFLRFIAQLYVDFFRSTPLLVQILLVYFGLPAMFPNYNSFFGNTEAISGTIALTLNTAAYQAEIIRGGILSIPTGQTEASRALGLSSIQTMQYVILPQAIRMILPPLTNELVNVILNSSLVSAVGVWDLTKWAQSLQSFYFLWTIFFIAAIYYFIITFSLSKLAKVIEEKYRIPGLGVANE
jgi:ABC-type amino acid transport system permease subunit